MNRLAALVLSAILMIASYGLGYRRGKGWSLAEDKARDAKIEFQVKQLVDIAYPQDCRVAFVISVPPAQVAEEVEKHKSAPEVVRAILYQEVNQEETDFVTNFGKGLSPANQEIFWASSGKAAFDEYQKRVLALRDWKPNELPTHPGR